MPIELALNEDFPLREIRRLAHCIVSPRKTTGCPSLIAGCKAHARQCYTELTEWRIPNAHLVPADITCNAYISGHEFYHAVADAIEVWARGQPLL
jgi:hypothetical protein